MPDMKGKILYDVAQKKEIMLSERSQNPPPQRKKGRILYMILFYMKSWKIQTHQVIGWMEMGQ
jgi:hypothetical protein